MMITLWLYFTVVLVSSTVTVTEATGYFGKRVGNFGNLQHAVKGDIYAVDSRTIHIKNFSYDGTAPDAFFYAGTSGVPSDNGIIIPDENGRKEPLSRYNNKDVTLTLPNSLTLNDIAWISIWCRAFTVDFGHIMMPHNFDYPRPQKIDSLSTLEHGVSSDRIVVVDAQTFLIPEFSYDGSAPDAHFWVGIGSKPGPNGRMVPDENGGTKPLKKYVGKTIVLTLPGAMTIFDIDYLSVWCRAFFADFGHVRIPKGLNIPPSLKMLGVAPQTKLNCEVLYDELAFEVRWAVAGDSIVMQLVGRIDNGDYMAFGLSGSNSRSVMVGGDVTVAWLDQFSGRGEAIDYFLDAKSQCQGGRGSCPDNKIRGGTENVRLLNAAFINEFTMLTFQRPLSGGDNTDIAFTPNREQAVIWAVGPVNSQGDTGYHRLRQRGDVFLDFGRSPHWNCPYPEDKESRKSPSSQNKRNRNRESTRPTPAPSNPNIAPWQIPPIPCYEPEDGVFYAQIGATGGDQGYNAITGHVGWGIAWYINGLLIPEINVVRGKTYTFVVEGGLDPNSPSRYHPFYITDDPEGGYEFKSNAERNRVQVFAGVDVDSQGNVGPSSFGRLCEWQETPGQAASEFRSFGAYQRSLSLECEEGQPGILQWTPDVNTPDNVYYQCYTHRYLGWKIRVHDQCNEGVSRADYDYFDYDNNGRKDKDEMPNHKDAVTIGGSTRYETKLPPRQKDSNTPNIFGHGTPLGFNEFDFNFEANRAEIFMNDIKKTNIKVPEWKYESSISNIATPSKITTINMAGFKTMDDTNDERQTKTDDYYFDTSLETDFYSQRPTSPISLKDFSDSNNIFDVFGNQFYSTEEHNNIVVNQKTTEPPIRIKPTARTPYRRHGYRRRKKPFSRNEQQNRGKYVSPPRRTEENDVPSLPLQEVSKFNEFEKNNREFLGPEQKISSYNHADSYRNIIKPSQTKSHPTIQTYVVQINPTKNSKVIENANVKTLKQFEVKPRDRNFDSSFKIFRPSSESNQREIDPATGIHFAQNLGFDPNSIVYEKDFQPVESVESEYPMHSTNIDVFSDGTQSLQQYEVPKKIFNDIVREPIRSILVTKGSPYVARPEHYVGQPGRNVGHPGQHMRQPGRYINQRGRRYDTRDRSWRRPASMLRPPPYLRFPFFRFPRSLKPIEASTRIRRSAYPVSEALASLNMFTNAPLPNLERRKLLSKTSPIVKKRIFRRQYRDLLKMIKSRQRKFNVININSNRAPIFKDDYNTFPKWNPLTATYNNSKPLLKSKMIRHLSNETLKPFSSKNIVKLIGDFSKRLSISNKYEILPNKTPRLMIKTKGHTPAPERTYSAYLTILKDVWNNLIKSNYHLLKI